MTVKIDTLVSRIASIFSDLKLIPCSDLEAFANDEASNADTPTRFLRGLVRTRNVGLNNLRITSSSSAISEAIVPALPGFYVIDLVPLADGGFDTTRVLREPVIAWKIEGGHYASPIIAGNGVLDRWAVLTPDNLVVTDWCTALCYKYPLNVLDWIAAEIEWLNSPENEGDFLTASQTALGTLGPVPLSIWLMMRVTPTWIGSVGKLDSALKPYRNVDEESHWPAEPDDLWSRLREVTPALAAVGICVDLTVDGLVRIERSGGDVVDTRPGVPPYPH